jgi:hypothetical protein
MTLIEKRFNSLCDVSDGGAILRAQWEYDKRLLTTALATIVTNFPHYSQHDASHSETILHRIASLLGTRGIDSLSCTDLWLLLEAAYNHDAGMIVLAIRKKDDLVSPAFSDFLDRQAEGDDRELATHISRVRNGSITANPVEIFELNESLLFVYADYVRRLHASRAKDAVLNPLGTIALPSPRTGLIPNRLLLTLANVCAAHGSDFESVLRLPHREMGLTTDYCHPRFLACMLRLGDLLDLDSGRFCPCVNAQVTAMPRLSLAHRSKHEGVSHLLVSPEVVSATGEYEDYEAYAEADRWFSWLREELVSQTLRWGEIAPSEALPRLPAVGAIGAKLKNQVLFGNGVRPRIEVNREKLLLLMRGANFYKGPQDAIRELMQNSVDATLARYSLDMLASGKPFAEDPRSLFMALRQYPISLDFVREELASNGKVKWLLTIIDNGFGMSLIDIKRLLSIGESRKTGRLRTLVSSLPDWAKPSGAFGIGFHSILEYANKVRLRTRCATELNSFLVDICRNEDSGEFEVVIREESGQGEVAPARAGTTIEAWLELEPIPSRVSVGDSHRTRAVLYKFDFLADSEVPYEASVIRSSSELAAWNSMCTFNVFGEAVESSYQVRPESSTRLFLVDRGIELELVETGVDEGGCDFMYRGMAVEGLTGFGLGLFSMRANIHAGCATDILQISRNKFSQRGERAAWTMVHESLDAAVSHWGTLQSVAESDKEFFALYTSCRTNDYSSTAWRKVRLHGGPSLGELVDLDCLELHIISPTRVEYRGQRWVFNKEKGLLSGVELSRVGSWFTKLLRAHFRDIAINQVSSDEMRVLLKKNRAAARDIDNDSLVESFLNHASVFFGVRFCVECPDRFSQLIASPKSSFVPASIGIFDQVMISPFVRSPDRKKLVVGDMGAYVRYLTDELSRSADGVKGDLQELGKQLWKSKRWSDSVESSEEEFQNEILYLFRPRRNS